MFSLLNSVSSRKIGTASKFEQLLKRGYWGSSSTLCISTPTGDLWEIATFLDDTTRYFDVKTGDFIGVIPCCTSLMTIMAFIPAEKINE